MLGVTEFDVKQIATGVGTDNKMVCGITEQTITVVYHTNNVMSHSVVWLLHCIKHKKCVDESKLG